MIYFEETDKEIIKYEVELDISRLESLKQQIVNNCSAINLNVYESEKEPKNSNNDLIDYHKESTGRFRSCYEGKKEIFKISYGEKNYPELASYIDLILKGNFCQAYDYLKIYTGNTLIKDKVKISYNEIKEKLIDTLNNGIENLNNFALNCYIEQIKLLEKIWDLNQNQQSDMRYYKDVMKCITLTEVDRIDKAAIRRVEGFQGISYTKKNRH